MSSYNFSGISLETYVHARKESKYRVRVGGRTTDGMRGVTRIKKKGGGRATVASLRQPTSYSREDLLQYARRILSTMRWQVPRRIEMRETRRGKRKKKERKRGGEERKGMEQKGQKGSPSITATTLRSELRAPKSRPVSMPRHRHSFSRGGVLCAFRRFSAGTARSLRLATASLRTAAAATAQRDETLPAAEAGGRAAPPVPVGRVYGCGTIGYLLLCIWHIVKLIERDDKIAMFFDVKRGERLARE